MVNLPVVFKVYTIYKVTIGKKKKKEVPIVAQW